MSATGRSASDQNSGMLREVRPGRLTMIDPQDIFGLVAELSLALAGFGGVAAAFGGSNRTYAPFEMDRLRALFLLAALPFATSLLALGLLGLEYEPARVYLLASIAGGLAQAPATAFAAHRAIAAWRDPQSITRWGGVALTLGLNFLALGLYVAGAVSPEVPGYLTLALGAQLVFGLWVFTRILLHRN